MSGGRLQALLLPFPPPGDGVPPIEGGSTRHGVRLHGADTVSRRSGTRLTPVSTAPGTGPDRLVHRPVGLAVRRQPHADRLADGAMRRVSAVGQARRPRRMNRLALVPGPPFPGRGRPHRPERDRAGDPAAPPVRARSAAAGVPHPRRRAGARARHPARRDRHGPPAAAATRPAVLSRARQARTLPDRDGPEPVGRAGRRPAAPGDPPEQPRGRVRPAGRVAGDRTRPGQAAGRRPDAPVGADAGTAQRHPVDARRRNTDASAWPPLTAENRIATGRAWFRIGSAAGMWALRGPMTARPQRLASLPRSARDVPGGAAGRIACVVSAAPSAPPERKAVRC